MLKLAKDIEPTAQIESVEQQLCDYGIDEAQAADLRVRLSTFAEDWNRPEMDAYDAL